MKLIERNKELLYWGSVLVLMCVPIVSIGDNIGMYFDSVFPDYAATQILDPQEFQVRWFVAYPYLCQLYHGSVGVWISVLGILITGTTSILQHHLTNIILEFIALIFMDRILWNNDVSEPLRRSILLLLAMSPTISTIAMTQYFIELPGTICMLGSVVIYDMAVSKTDPVKQKLFVFLSFFLAGFAFYSYFNFLFFAIGFMVCVVFDRRTACNVGTRFMLACYGYLSGSVLYLAGFTKMAASSIANMDNKVLPILVWAFVWAICGIMFVLISKGKWKVVLVCSGLFLLIGIVVLVLCGDFISSSMDSLDVGGYYSAGLTERIKIVFKNYYYALTGTSAEDLIFQEQITIGWKLLAFIFWLLFIVYCVLAVISKNIINKTSAYIFIGLVYMMCCVPFATRVQTQHFIPLIFWTFVVMGMMLQYIIDFLKKNVKDMSNTTTKFLHTELVVICAILIVTGGIMITNRYKVVDRVLETGGKGYYTSEVNHLAESALERQKMGEKEIYIFPEWGFMSGFNYLTGNDVAFTTDCRTEAIENLLDMGYEVNIVYWNDDNGENTKEYKDMIESLKVKENIENYYNYEGEIVFSVMEVIK